MSYFLLELALRLYNYTIDIRDYVNGIGNRSREQYVNDGRALRVIVRWMALWSSMCSSIEGVASKRRQIESSGIEELYQQVL